MKHANNNKETTTNRMNLIDKKKAEEKASFDCK
jgi:hypothetical protein